MRTRRRRDAGGDRRLQRGGLPRDARAARLAARAAAEAIAAFGPTRRRRRRVARGASREASSGPSCARRCSSRRPAVALAGELLEYHRRERGPLVGVLRAPRDVAGGAGRGRRGDRRSSRRPGPSRSAKSHAWTFAFPPQEHKLGPGQASSIRRPAQSRRAHRARPRRADARPQARAEARGGAATGALIPGGPTTRRRSRTRSSRLGRSLLAGDRRYPGARVAAPARRRIPAPVQTIDLDELERCCRARRSYLFIQGPPGTGKTWTGARLVVHLIARGSGSASPPRATRRSTTCSTRSRRARTSGLASAAARRRASGNPESYYESEPIDEPDRRRGLPRAGRSWPAPPGCSPSELRLDARLPRHRRGRAGVARRRARDGDGRAQRHAARRSAAARAGLAGHAPGGRGRVRPRAPARRRADDPARTGRLPRAHAPHAPGRLPVHLGVVYEGRLEGIRARRAPTAFGTGMRYLPVEHEGRRRVARGGGADPGRDRPRARGRRCAGERLHGRRALQRPGAPAPRGAARRRAGRHRGQVPGAGGAGRLLLDGDLERRGRPAHPRVPLLAQPPQRRDLARAVPGVPRLLARACSRSGARTIEQMRLVNALCRFVEIAEEQG